MTTHRPLAVLVRHGETTWSATGRHTGLTDVALTENGEAQARALRGRLAGRHFTVVLSSPLSRATRTAELAGLTAFDLEADLREWDYGEFEGATTDEIRQEFPGWTVWDGPWPGGETIEQVAERADRVVDRVRRLPRPPDGPATALIVAHGHILRVLAARWIGAPPQTGRSVALETGTLSELGWERDTAVIERWNA